MKTPFDKQQCRTSVDVDNILHVTELAIRVLDNKLFIVHICIEDETNPSNSILRYA